MTVWSSHFDHELINSYFYFFRRSFVTFCCHIFKALPWRVFQLLRKKIVLKIVNSSCDTYGGSGFGGGNKVVFVLIDSRRTRSWLEEFRVKNLALEYHFLLVSSLVSLIYSGRTGESSGSSLD